MYAINNNMLSMHSIPNAFNQYHAVNAHNKWHNQGVQYNQNKPDLQAIKMIDLQSIRALHITCQAIQRCDWRWETVN